ncbi:tape measure protein [Lactobacillus sp. CC-MHH1034]|uniref:tape measure protein n=1 Tax=Agrilactobacillus fermenti TaxID=2586909 RepID=UPI001E535267|nr:tape measure protein [Agrilactobacillus fermenti]MCD2255779.1 tape measure protein [Agrilactobacillus fermenti]
MESGSITARLRANDENYTSTFNKAIGTLKSFTQQHTGAMNVMGSFKGMVASVAAGMGVYKAASAGVNLVMGQVHSAFARLDTMQNFNRSMTVLVGSSEKANETLNELKDISHGTAYGLDVMAQATQGFATSGVDVKKSVDYVKDFANAVSFYGDGTNEQLKQVTYQMQQMAAKGTANMGDLNTAVQAGIPVYRIYAQATGQSTEEVMKALSAGKISSEDFFNTLHKAFNEGVEGFPAIANAAKEAGATWQGTFDNMKAAITRGLTQTINGFDSLVQATFGKSIKQTIADFGSHSESVLTGFGTSISKASGIFTPFVSIIRTSFSGVDDSIKNAIGNIINYLKTMFSSMNDSSHLDKFKGAMDRVAEAIKKVADFVGNNFASAMNLLQKYAEALGIAFQGTGKIIGAAFKTIFDTLSDLFSSLSDTSAINVFQNAMTGVANVVKNVAGFVRDHFKGMIDTIKEHLEIVHNSFKGVGSAIGEAVSAVIDAFKSMYGNMTKQDEINTFKSGMGIVADAIKNAAGFIKEHANQIAYLIKSIGQLLLAYQGIKAIKTLSEPFIAAGKNVMDFYGKLNDLGNLMSIGWQQKVGGWTGLWETIKSPFLSVGQTISDFGSKINKTRKELEQLENIGPIRAFLQAFGDHLLALFPNLDLFITNMSKAREQMKLLDDGNAVTRFFRGFTASLETTFPKLRTFTNNIREPKKAMDKFVEGLAKMGQKATGTGPVIVSASNVIKGALTGIKNGFKSMLSTGVSAITKLNSAMLTNPITALLVAITAALGAVALAWSTNFGGMRDVVNGFWERAKPAFSAIKDAFKRLSDSFKDMPASMKKFHLGLVASILTPLALVADALRLIVNLLISFAEIIVRTGSAISKASKGDFKGAADEMKKGFSDAGNNISDVFTHSVTGALWDTVNAAGKTADKSNEVAKRMAKDANKITDSFSKMSDKAKEAGENLRSAFNNIDTQDVYKYYSDLVSLVNTSLSAMTQAHKDYASKLKEAQKKDISERKTVQQNALNDLLKDHQNSYNNLLSVYESYAQQLKNNTDVNGNKLSEDQRQALQSQFDQVYATLQKENGAVVQAGLDKIKLKQNLSVQEQEQVSAALTAEYNLNSDAIARNNDLIKQKQDELNTAKDESQRKAIEQEIKQLQDKNASILNSETTFGQQLVQITSQNGKANLDALTNAMEQQKGMTKQELQGILQEWRDHGGSINQETLLIAQYLQQNGVQGSDNWHKALTTKKPEEIKAAFTDEIQQGIQDLPNKLFQGGSKGKDKYIEAIKSGDYTGAGKYLNDKTSAGADSNRKKMSDSGKNAAKDYVKNVKNQKDAAKAAGTILADNTKSGADSKKKQIGDVGDTAGYRFQSGVKGRKNDSKNAGTDLSNSAKNGAKSVGGFDNIGGNMAAGVATGIRSNSWQAESEMQNLVDRVNEKARQAGKIHSPSRLMRDSIGKNLALGIAVGIKQYAQSAVDEAQNLITGIQHGVAGATSWMNNSQLFNTNLKQSVDINDNRKQQPLQVQLNMGGTVFSAFVDNISTQQSIDLEMDRY